MLLFIYIVTNHSGAKNVIFTMITDPAEGLASNMVAGKHWHI